MVHQGILFLTRTILRHHDTQHNDTQHNGTHYRQLFHYAECLKYALYAECHYDKCRYAEFHYVECCNTIFDWVEKIGRDKHSSLFVLAIIVLRH